MSAFAEKAGIFFVRDKVSVGVRGKRAFFCAG